MKLLCCFCLHRWWYSDVVILGDERVSGPTYVRVCRRCRRMEVLAGELFETRPEGWR